LSIVIVTITYAGTIPVIDIGIYITIAGATFIPGDYRDISARIKLV